MKPFGEFVAAAGPWLAAWDYEDPARTRLSLFCVGDQRLTSVAQAVVPPDERERTVDRLVAQGVRIGASYAGKVFVWVADEQGFTVWAGAGVLASDARDAIEVTRVTLFVDPDDRGHRGVRFTHASGRQQVVVEEHDPIPQLDPGYGDQDLFLDTLWARYLGEQLALWLLVPFVDEVSGGTIDDDLTIARTARALADQLEGADSSAELVASMGPIRHATKLSLCIDPPRQAVLLRISSERETTSVRLEEGTRAQLAAFLRRVSTPRTVLRAMNDQLQLHAAKPR